MQPKILTFTLNPAIDFHIELEELRVGEVQKARGTKSVVGGKGINVASALAACGVEVAVSGLLGRSNDDAFISHFEKHSIENRMISVEGEVRTNVKIFDRVSGLTTDINSNSKLQITKIDLDKSISASRDAEFIVICGSLPPSVAPSIYKEMIGAFKEKLVFLDSSGDAFARAIEARPYLIKPNLHELSEFVGAPLHSDFEIVEQAKALVQRGVEKVVVSLAERGAIFVDANSAYRAAPIEFCSTQSVGAGDAMMAGLVFGTSKKMSWSETARTAMAFSQIHLTDGFAKENVEAQISAQSRQVLLEPVQ